MTNKIKYGIIENVNIIHELMLEIAMRQEVGLRWIWLSTPIGRGSGFKIRKVWIRIPPELPLVTQAYAQHCKLNLCGRLVEKLKILAL